MQDFKVLDPLSSDEISRLEGIFQEYSPLKNDPWGASYETLKSIIPYTKLLYEKYFKVEATGFENLPEGPAVFIANHGGQIPVDGLVIVHSMLLKAPKARLLRGMVERWVPTLPFIGATMAKLGQIVGDQRNCLHLLQHKQSVLVFPEGVIGSGKPIHKKYQLQKFPSGFLRLALEAKVPIVPVAVIGSEESYPALFNFKPLAKILGVPYFPITPTFPFLGPLGLIPLPTKIKVSFAKPIYIEKAHDAPDSEILPIVEDIQKTLQELINSELKIRGSKVFTFQEDSCPPNAETSEKLTES